MEAAELDDAISLLVEDATDVIVEGEAPHCRDEKDRKHLHCALAGEADYLITRDKDLLTLEKIGSCAILVPEAFLAVVVEPGSEKDS